MTDRETSETQPDPRTDGAPEVVEAGTGDEAVDAFADEEAAAEEQAAGDEEAPAEEAPGSRRGRPDPAFVGSPAKVMRIGTMVKQLLEEVRNAPLDDAARARLAEVHDRSLRELAEGLSDDLVAELQRITLPFSDDGSPSDAELRIAQAQLVGWLEGLFHGLQTALVAQQMSTQAQLAQMRRALPPGVTAALPPEAEARREERPPGQYL